MTGSSIWDRVLSRIETKVNRHIFYTWFKPTSLIADEGERLQIRVPNGLFRDWLTKHYAAVLDEALAEVDRKGASIRFISEPTDAVKPPPTIVTKPAVESATSLVEAAPDEDEAPPGGLAPRYSFDTFIVGSSNQFAHAACRAVAEAPSRSYNPLFIYGGVGLGKTHLMHA